MIRVVLFDVGGVLVELSGVVTMLEWLGKQTPVERLWHTWLHSPSVRAFETGRMEADAFATELIRELGISVEVRQFLKSFEAWPTGLFPGALDMIGRIPPRYVRALLSNSNSLHWPRVVNEMGLGAVFEHRFVSHLTGRIKPDAEAFEHVLATLQCTPQSVLFLDDNALNVESALRLGMHAHVVRGVQEAERALIAAGVFDA